jgi:protein SCO1/2
VGDYLKTGKPLILTLGYYQCPMLCSLVLNGMTDAMKGQSLKLGQDYNILSVSINPNEKADLAAAKRKSYLGVIASGAKQSMDGHGAELLAMTNGSGWTFAVGSEEQVRRLADTVGFGYKYDERSKEYVHSAGIFLISPDGKLSQTLYGISFRPADFKMSLIEASQGKIGSLLERIILSCFHYEPDSHRYGVYIFGVMRLAGLVTVIVLAVVLGMFWKRERRVRAWTA